MNQPKARLTQAEQYVREGTERLARAKARIEELRQHGHTQAADQAQESLALLQHTLAMAQAHLRHAQRERDNRVTACAEGAPLKLSTA